MADHHRRRNLRPDLSSLHLQSGAHNSRDDGVCAMEAVAWLAGEPHSDAPECTCPVLAAFVRVWNDGLPDADRDRLLLPILPRLVGTRSTPEVEQRRSWMAVDWLVREHLPAWLEMTERLRSHAEALRALPETTAATVGAARPVIGAARAAAGAAARDATGAAARAAARDATRAAAWDAGRDAAWDAGRDAAGAAAWDAAAAAAAAGAAARDAARAALAPTVDRLQQSAMGLLDRMIAAGQAKEGDS